MKKTLIILSLFLFAACGPSQEEKQNIAQNACSIMGETKKLDSLFRTQVMIDAREKIGGGAFVRGDNAIIESFEFGICKELVLNENYDEILQSWRDTKREYERIEAEKRAEEQRIADSKPTVKEEFFSNGRLKSRTNYQPKSKGGKRDGLYESYYVYDPFFSDETDQLKEKGNYKDGEKVGLWELYYRGGSIDKTRNYKDGENAYIEQVYHMDRMVFKRTYKNGVLDGLTEEFHGRDNFLPENYGKLLMTGHYKDGKKVGLWVNYHKNGRLESKENWKDGKAVGLWEKYSWDGKSYYRYNYKDGYENGLRETYRYQDVPDNYLDGEYMSYETINIKGGAKHGIQKTQYSNGDVINFCFVNGKDYHMVNCTE